MYKQIIYLVFINLFLIGCQSPQTKFQQAVTTIEHKNLKLENIKFIIIIPEAGCAGCISNIEEFYTQNSNNESLFFIFSNIMSQKMLKSKLQINNSNTFLDIENKLMECYPEEKKIYPCILEFEEGKIKNIYYQSPDENGLFILKNKLKI